MSARVEAIIREIETMLSSKGVSGGYQVAKTILRHATDSPAGAFKSIGANGAGRKRPMAKEEAERIVAEAKIRIAGNALFIVGS